MLCDVMTCPAVLYCLKCYGSRVHAARCVCDCIEAARVIHFRNGVIVNISWLINCVVSSAFIGFACKLEVQSRYCLFQDDEQ